MEIESLDLRKKFFFENTSDEFYQKIECFLSTINEIDYVLDPDQTNKDTNDCTLTQNEYVLLSKFKENDLVDYFRKTRHDHAKIFYYLKNYHCESNNNYTTISESEISNHFENLILNIMFVNSLVAETVAIYILNYTNYEANTILNKLEDILDSFKIKICEEMLENIFKTFNEILLYLILLIETNELDSNKFLKTSYLQLLYESIFLNLNTKYQLENLQICFKNIDIKLLFYCMLQSKFDIQEEKNFLLDITNKILINYKKCANEKCDFETFANNISFEFKKIQDDIIFEFKIIVSVLYDTIKKGIVLKNFVDLNPFDDFMTRLILKVSQNADFVISNKKFTFYLAGILSKINQKLYEHKFDRSYITNMFIYHQYYFVNALNDSFQNIRIGSDSMGQFVIKFDYIGESTDCFLQKNEFNFQKSIYSFKKLFDHLILVNRSKIYCLVSENLELFQNIKSFFLKFFNIDFFGDFDKLKFYNETVNKKYNFLNRNLSLNSFFDNKNLTSICAYYDEICEDIALIFHKLIHGYAVNTVSYFKDLTICFNKTVLLHFEDFNKTFVNCCISSNKLLENQLIKLKKLNLLHAKNNIAIKIFENMALIIKVIYSLYEHHKHDYLELKKYITEFSLKIIKEYIKNDVLFIKKYIDDQDKIFCEYKNERNLVNHSIYCNILLIFFEDPTFSVDFYIDVIEDFVIRMENTDTFYIKND